MGVSTQRLLILVIGINLILSLSFAIYEAPRAVNYGIFGETIDLGENSASITEGESASVSPANLQEEGSFGSSLRMGRTIFNLFVRGLVSLPFDSTTYTDPLTKIFAIMLILFRVAFGVLLILELYLLYKNKKAP